MSMTLQLIVIAMNVLPQPTEFLAFKPQPDITLEIWAKTPLPCPVYWLAVHENEKVANAYVANRVLQSGGLLAVLRQRGERHVYLNHAGKSYAVDPNRVFTKLGAAATLLTLNEDLEADTVAHDALTTLALKLGAFMLEPMARFGQTPSIIALHNNTPGYDDDGKEGEGTVSIQRYLKKQQGGSAFIAEVHVNPAHDEDDLFFITHRSDYEQMKKDNWNILLQHKQVAILADEDDGSLSVFAEMKGWRYINIEAQRDPDHLEMQCKMVDYVWQLLGCP